MENLGLQNFVMRCRTLRTMKNLVVVLSLFAIVSSPAVFAGEAKACNKNKAAACEKSKAACNKAKAACDKTAAKAGCKKACSKSASKQAAVQKAVR